MSDSAYDTPSPARKPIFRTPLTLQSALLTGAAILAAGLVLGGYLLGDGLRRAHAADRSVTVRGVAERNVTADRANWQLNWSATAPALAAAQAEADRQAQAVRDFLHAQGVVDKSLPITVDVSRDTDHGKVSFTVSEHLAMETEDVALAQGGAGHQADLVRAGVAIANGSGVTYSFTRLNAIKPAMIADATRGARAAAEQFAHDSGTGVGRIRSATQGYFTVTARDSVSTGDDSGGGDDQSTPLKKVRVVTTVTFELD